MTRRPLCLLLLLSGAACSLLGQIGILSTSPLPPAYVGLPYTYSFSAFVQAPLPAATWSTQTSPATPPPPGLTLSPNGTLSGTPTTPTNLLPYTFTVVAQTGDFSVSMQFQMTVSNPVVVINTTSLPSAVLNQPYSFTLSASSNPAGVTWSVGSPGLAPGLSLSPNGVLSGAVSPTGTFYMNFIATITGTNVSTNYTIPLTVYAGQVVIQTTSIPQAQSGNAYSVTLAATPTGVTWAETGSLPVGITFNSTTGVLSGVTNAIGTYPIQVTASLTSWASASQNLILYVNTGTLAIPQTSLPAAVQGSPYAGSIRVTGGLPPYQWALVSTGNDGLSIGSTTGGVTGTPTAAGNFLLTVMVTDASGVSVTQALSLFVATPLQVATTSLPAATVGVAYSQILLPGGGVGPYVWNVVTGSGTLPPGLTLSGPGTLSGTPTNNGTSTFTVQVTDSGGRSATGTLSLSVSLGTLSITTSSLPNGQLSTPYSQTVTASGGAPPYTWTVASGGLPGGLGLATSSSGTGVISGTPTGPLGTIAFTLQVTDSNKLTAQKAFTINIATTLTITTLNLPAGTKGVAYPSTQILASGGTPPYTWSISSGSLPPGLNLAPGTGAISGTPTASGSTVFTVVVTDSAGTTASVQLTLTVNSAAAPLSITTSGTVSAVAGTSFTEALAATGGAPPYTWSATGLPAGLQVSGSSIAGTPTAAATGTANVTLTVTDSASNTASGSLTITVTLPPAPTTMLGAISGSPASQATPSLSLAAGYPFAISGTLTVSFQSAVGGTPTEVGFVTSGGGLVQTVPFTIAANSTKAVFPNAPVLVTGTVAGTISLTAVLSAGGVVLTPNPAAGETFPIGQTPPVIDTVTFASNSGGLTVSVIGYSTTRQMNTGQFQFYTSSGPILEPVTVQLGSAFTTWYSSSASNPYGSQFTLTVPFTVPGNAADVVKVNATLTNSQGTSNSLETVPGAQ